MKGIYSSEAGRERVLALYGRMLERWPVPAEHLRVPTREGETFVLACGPSGAAPVVLLHGSGANSATWGGDVAQWSRDRRVYAVDLVGEAGLSAPSRPVLGSEAPALWLDDVLEGLGVERAAFVGLSLGGWTALDYAVRRPERVERLALLCPAGIGRQTTAKWLPRFLVWRLFGRRGLRRSAAHVAGLGAPEHREALDFTVEVFSCFRPRTERLPVFSDRELAGLSVPVQVLVGERDAMIDPRETLRRVRAHFPDAEAVLLPGVGHAVLGQTEAVGRFLRA
ncbi:alpha/beta fold hydrolase [Nocardiopsis sp. LOL_012]|uniref:alpha/beta fold hydrolase n=1 Tax=Nocardiopsis sp. LOL_012 TaxID=3345409 RepID=UPI003A8926A3